MTTTRSAAGGRRRLFGDHHIYGRDGVLYTRDEADHLAVADPRHRSVDLGFPQNR